jgi:hypothetical protein
MRHTEMKWRVKDRVRCLCNKIRHVVVLRRSCKKGRDRVSEGWFPTALAARSMAPHPIA